MEERERKELDEKAQKVKEEVLVLKSQLTDLNNKKERWFEKKEALKKDIADLIKKIKALKSSKDTFNKDIETFKKERDSYNKQVKEFIGQFKKLDEERKSKLEKYGLKKDPSSIKEQIAALKSRLETDAVDFEKEKKMMAQIKTLKKKYESVKDVVEVTEKCNKISEIIKEAKDKAEQFHAKLKEYANEGKGDYSDFIKLSKSINEIKKEQEEAFANFIKSKQAYLDVSKALRAKLSELNTIEKRFAEERAKAMAEKKKKEEAVLENKAAQVEEKLKTKKKLTTEDLLVFQREAFRE